MQMGTMSVWHWVVVFLVIVLLFGAKKIPELAKGLGSGIKTFKKELEDDDKNAEQTTAKTEKKDSVNQNENKKAHVELIEAEVVDSNYNAKQKEALKPEKN